MKQIAPESILGRLLTGVLDKQVLLLCLN